MIHNQFIREAIIDENSAKKEFVSNFPTLIHPYFMSLGESEKIKLFNNLGYKYDEIDRSSFSNSSISSFTNLMIHAPNPINLKSASFIIENLISYNKDLDKKDLKSYVGNIALHCIAKSLNDKTTSPSEENIIFIDKYSNYFKYILKDDDSNKEFLSKVSHVKTLLEYTQNSYPETHKKITFTFKNQFEKVIEQTWKTDSYRIKETILNTSFLLKNFSQYDLLDSINKNNLELNKVYSYRVDSYSNKSKQIYDFPLIFTLFEKNPEVVMPWILKIDNIDKIKEIKYKNKNIVEYFADSDHINLILDHLTKDDQAFKKLIIDNKKVFKKMANHENQALKIATTYHGMSINLEEKDVQSVKRKI